MTAVVDLAELGGALDRREFRLAYQPKVSIATGRIVGVEALLRWDHPTRGVLPPVEFIAAAEAHGLIVPIGAWVLEEACRQGAAWARSFPTRPSLQVAVNVSALQCTDDLHATVTGAMDASGLDPALLCLELTESTVMTDIDHVIALLDRLKRLGVSVAIDDFGTGFSSLAYLRRLPLDELKIDKSFVDGLGQEAPDTAIVSAIVAMAHALDLAVVAEGVETERQLAALRRMGCEQAQGYYFAEPQWPDDLGALLVAEADGSWAGHEGERATESGADAGSYRNDKVVIIDDTADVRQLARMSLSAAGFEVHEAASGGAGIAKVVELHPDCVVLDVRMPDMDGYGVCRMLRANPATADCTIVMLTGEASPNDKIQAFAAGADDYIVKPFAPRDLINRVQAAMGRRRDVETG